MFKRVPIDPDHGIGSFRGAAALLDDRLMVLIRRSAAFGEDARAFEVAGTTVIATSPRPQDP
jgi:hypothetical protein